MIAVFTLLYIGAICLVYKTMKIKPTPRNIAAFVVVGIVAIGGIVIGWKFSAPSSSQLVVSRYVVSLVPQVKGPITKIHAEPNVPLKKDRDILFEIQTDTYQNTVDQVSASLEAAKKSVLQLEAGSRAATAAVTQAEANLAAAKAELDVAIETEKLNPDAIAKLTVAQLTQQFKGAEAGVAKAKASEEQANAGLESARDTVTSINAQLANAKFNLEQCTVYAPADGFVTNWQVREGTMVVPMPLTSAGTFIDTSRVNLIATFPQNVLRYVKPGDKAEISLKNRPGEFFTATVQNVVQASGEGQFQTSSQMISAADIQSNGMFIVKFQLDDEDVANNLAMGTAGTAVIYTDTGKPFHVISKVVIRMNAWMYYLFPS